MKIVVRHHEKEISKLRIIIKSTTEEQSPNNMITFNDIKIVYPCEKIFFYIN